MIPAAEHDEHDAPAPRPCSAASHRAGELGCVPSMPATWLVIFTHGARGEDCSAPTYVEVCDGRRAWVDALSLQPAGCPDCGRVGVYSDLVRIATQL